MTQHAEEALRESQARIQAILDAAVDAIITIDERGIVESANPAVERLFGYRPSELIGQNISMLMPSPYREGHDGYIARYLRTGEARAMGLGREVEGLRRDGSVFPLELAISEVRGSDKRRFTGILRDITLRKQAEEELRESHGRIQAILDAAVDAIITIDERGIVESANLAVERLFGYAPSELIGQNVSMLMPSPYREGHDGYIARYLRTGEARAMGLGREVEGLRRDGSVFPLELAISEVRGGDKRRFTGILRDITLRKQAEGALLRAEAERQLRDTANSVPGAVYQLRITPDGRREYTFMGGGLLDLGGIAAEDAMRDYTLLDRLIFEEDSPALEQAFGLALSALEPLTHIFRIRRPDANVRWIEARAVPRAEPDASIIFNGYWFDVTQQRETEEALAQAKAVADAANRAKSSFLAAMSHEIRTPMNGVLGMLELLSLTRLDAEQRANVEVIRESGRSLLRIINDILDFSKIEAGMLDLNPEPASVADIVRGVTEIYSGAASAKNLLLSGSVDPKVSPAVKVDPLRLRQILNNFVSNALKFTTQGSITIAADLAGRQDGVNNVRFSVTDTGIGISEENQKKLFQPFVQAEGDTTRRFGGTGLGLVICRRLAELMGGTIEMESAVGRGTTMRLVVPLPQADPSEIEPEDEGASITSTALNSRRPAPSVDVAVAEGTLVLVADDHPTNRLMLMRQLNLLGYAAEAVEDGVQALEAWRSGRFGLLLTDCHMPKMDGYDLAGSIREAERGNVDGRTPIIACTANVLEGEAEACLAAGMDAYLPKPVELAALLRMLDAWLPLPEGAATAVETVQTPPPAAAANGGGASPIDRAKLAEVSLGDADFEREMLADFRGAMDEDANHLAVALDTGNHGDITRISHRLKGASRAVGATDLATISERMEHAGRASDAAAIVAAKEPLFDEIKRLRAHLENF